MKELKKNMKTKEKYQTVYIEIKGEVYAFTGKAMPHTTGRIDSIKFSRPKELPDDLHFGEIPDLTIDELDEQIKKVPKVIRENL